MDRKLMQQIGIKKRVSFIGAGQLFNALINVLMVPYLARALSTESYGTYGQVLMVVGIFQVILSFGFSKLIYNQLSKEGEEKKDLVFNTFVSSFFLAILGVAILAISSHYISGFFNNAELTFYLQLFSGSILFNLLSQLVISILNYYNLVQRIALLTIVNNVIRVVVIFVAIQFYQSLAFVFWGLLLLSVIHFLLLWFSSPIHFFEGRFQWKLLSQLMKMGLPLSMSGVATMLIVQTDGVMISRLLDTTSYAIYRMGAIPIPFIFIIYSSVITITMPEVTKMFHSGKIFELVQFKKRASFNIAVLTYPVLIFILLFSEEIIELYLGDQYRGSQTVFVIYNLLLFLRVNDFRDVLIAKGKTKVILLSDIIVFGLNIVLNYFLISLLGIEGAAIASIVSFYLLSFILLRFTSRELAVRMTDFFNFKRMFQLILISLFLGSVCYYLYSFFLVSYWWIIPLSIMYFIMTYFMIIKLKVASIQQLIEFSGRVKLLHPLNQLLKRIQ